MRFQAVADKNAPTKKTQTKILSKHPDKESSTAQLETNSDSRSQTDIQDDLASKRETEARLKQSKHYLLAGELGDSNAQPLSKQFEDRLDGPGYIDGSHEGSMEAAANQRAIQAFEARKPADRSKQPQGGIARSHRSNNAYFE